MWCDILARFALTAAGLTLLAGNAVGHETSLREQLVGIWKIVFVNNSPDSYGPSGPLYAREQCKTLGAPFKETK